MKLTFRTLALTLLIVGLAMTAAFAQKPPKAPDYRIAVIQVNAFDEAEGEMSDAIPESGEPRSFFNDLSTSLFVWVVIEGKAGSFEAGRKAGITVMEGKKLKTSRIVQIGIPNKENMYFVPVFVYGPLCSEVKITAKIIGQKTASLQQVKIPFQCGE